MGWFKECHPAIGRGWVTRIAFSYPSQWLPWLHCRSMRIQAHSACLFHFTVGCGSVNERFTDMILLRCNANH
ncbi:hypothetical protein BO78DRAFT_128925 [Aspergillus sclerotiicarbonarius CBS 121057]|uniref:Uncharacterized protein n=1 Tax=Aspergillus sclerotiicarbonarius (strain CBS 121057 / IBT 28362) TaxID=1448318 RepID=A0A319E839_ASPSB|nr:hypothetical protein BO78DRAFT_128925 [Aspergillus sclerotiicarbonarius CBS 121057]